MHLLYVLARRRDDDRSGSGGEGSYDRFMNIRNYFLSELVWKYNMRTKREKTDDGVSFEYLFSDVRQLDLYDADFPFSIVKDAFTA